MGACLLIRLQYSATPYTSQYTSRRFPCEMLISTSGGGKELFQIMTDILYDDGPDTDGTGPIGQHSGKLLGKLRVRPQGQADLLLGTFSPEDNLKGFSIGIAPKSEVSDSIVTRIANAGSGDEYKLLLHIANNSPKVVTATIWRL